MRTWCLGLGAALLALSLSRIAAADERCMWQNTFYGPGATSCQHGTQARCVHGVWELTGEQCADDAADPSGEEAEPGVADPSVGEPRVREPAARPEAAPQVPPVGND